MNEWMTKMLKSQQNRLSLPIKNQNQTTNPIKYKANKTVLIIFSYAYRYICIDQTLSSLPVTKCHTERTPSPPLSVT